MKKIFLLTTLIGISCANSVGQNSTSLDKLITHIQAYLDKMPALQSRVILNQQKYYIQDTVFFKAYFLDVNQAPIKGKAFMNLVLTDYSGKNLKQISFTVKDGIGFSQLVLPDSITPGKYRVAVFNDWMRNFNAAVIGFQDFLVVGMNELIPSKESPKIQFHVEGGSFVQGIPGRILIQSNQQNKRLAITDNQSHELTSMQLDNEGSGDLIFTPKGGELYYGKVEGLESLFPLPVPKQDGLSMMVAIDEKQDQIKSNLFVSGSADLKNQDLHLILIAGQRIHYSTTIKLGNKDGAVFLIPTSGLPEGIVQLIVVKADWTVLAQRCLLISRPVNHSVLLEVEGHNYRPREKVELLVSLSNNQQPIQGEFSVSITKQFGSRSTEKFGTNLNPTFGLYSDTLKVDKFNKQLIAFDGFHNWSRMLGSTTITPDYPLRSRKYIKGKAYSTSTGKPVPDSTLISVYLQQGLAGYQAATNSKGEFDITFLFDFYGDDELFYIVQRNGRTLQDVSIEILNKPFTGIPFERWVESEKRDLLGDYKSKIALINKSYNFFSTTTEARTHGPQNLNARFEEEFMGADVTVKVDDYIVLPTMEDLIREVVPDLRVRKTKSRVEVSVIFSNSPVNPPEGPLYIIDGLMTKKSELFLSINPKDVQSIKVENDLNKLTRLGILGENGIVYVQTKNENIARKIKDTNVAIPIQGIIKPVSQIWPNHADARDNRRPDFRTTLFWSPSESTGSDGKKALAFYLGDDVGAVYIDINGFSHGGHLITINKTIEVSLPD